MCDTMADTPPPSPQPTFGESLARFAAWCRREPASALLFAGVVLSLIYFFGFFKIFTNGALTTARWAWEAWNPENNQEHAVLIMPIAIFLVWHDRDRIAAATKSPSNLGMLFVGLGIALFILAARTLQPRIAIVALPLLIYGCVRFLWGREVGRVFVFPCAFMFFMLPIGGLVQGTVTLQLLVSSVCNVLASFVGVQIEATGTTIRSLDGSFNFDIAEGCSGIRSLMAMTTLTALYVHFTQNELWKKVAIFGGSLVFAVIGNIGRIFTVILVAKYVSPRLAGGIYHDYSGFVFFPIAVMAMVGFSNLLNADWTAVQQRWLRPEKAPAPLPLDADVKPEDEKPASPISYDY